MAVDEQSRYQLHQRLEEVLGPDEATVLMEHLPPVGWADVAKKSDIAAMDITLAALRFELIGTFKAELASQTRSLFFAIVALNATTVGVLLAALG